MIRSPSSAPSQVVDPALAAQPVPARVAVERVAVVAAVDPVAAWPAPGEVDSPPDADHVVAAPCRGSRRRRRGPRSRRGGRCRRSGRAFEVPTIVARRPWHSTRAAAGLRGRDPGCRRVPAIAAPARATARLMREAGAMGRRARLGEAGPLGEEAGEGRGAGCRRGGHGRAGTSRCGRGCSGPSRRARSGRCACSRPCASRWRRSRRRRPARAGSPARGCGPGRRSAAPRLIWAIFTRPSVPRARTTKRGSLPARRCLRITRRPVGEGAAALPVRVVADPGKIVEGEEHHRVADRQRLRARRD